MRYVVTAEQMRALDQTTIEVLGLPGVVLMENAGRRVAEIILSEMVDADRSATVAVVCGAGNNGGDGYVIARCLREEGVAAEVYLAAREESLRGDARLHYHVYQNMGGAVVDISQPDSLSAHADAIESADIIVDAVFGTGLARPVTGHYARVIETINRGRGERLAVDIPSGLSADTGRVLGVGVAATRTVTMAFLKVGLAISPGFAQAGTVTEVEIGIPRQLAREHGVAAAMLEASDVAHLVPTLGPLDHKNRRGHLLAIAGSPGKRGAGRLVSWAALRTGAGLVTLASPWPRGEPTAPDPVMTAEFDPDDPSKDPVERLLELMKGKAAVALGPGMPTTEGGRSLVRGALSRGDRPLILDADALNHIGTDLARVANAQAPIIMTPHPGEAARLLDCSTAEIERDRLGAVRSLADDSRAVVVLKGARSLICNGRASPVGGERPVTINPTGDAGLATAGSGDVLTGIIAALVAQGLTPATAARLGTYLHGRTGELASAALGPRSVTASDLAERLPDAIAELACQKDRPVASG